MKNELITKEEADAAGFKEIGEFKRAIGLNNSVDILLSLCYDYKSAFIYVKGEQIKEVRATKENINEANRFFTGKDLDFTPKQKDYSWEAVLSRMEAKVKHNITEEINQTNYTSVMPKELQAKLIALLKLHYIIEELDRDFEGNVPHYIYHEIDPSRLTFDFYNDEYHSGEITIKSEEAANILIDNHAQLLKDALGVK